MLDERKMFGIIAWNGVLVNLSHDTSQFPHCCLLPFYETSSIDEYAYAGSGLEGPCQHGESRCFWPSRNIKFVSLK